RPLRIRLQAESGARVILRGDRFADQDRLYDGPSFGDWPHFVPVKLQYDGDYRIPVRRALSSSGTASAVGDDRGWRPYTPTHRIRLVTLASNEGGLSWERAPVSARPGQVAVEFAGYCDVLDRAAALIEEGIRTVT